MLSFAYLFIVFWRKLIIKPSLPFHTVHGVLKEGILKWLVIPFSFLLSKKGNAKECSKYHTIALISHASKVMLKILQTSLQQYVNHELPGAQAGFKKAEEPEMKSTTSVGSEKKQENSRKTTSASLTTLKPLTVWVTTNCGKFFKRLKYQTALSASWEIYMQVKKQHLELDVEHQTGSKLGKEYVWLYTVTWLI